MKFAAQSAKNARNGPVFETVGIKWALHRESFLLFCLDSNITLLHCLHLSLSPSLTLCLMYLTRECYEIHFPHSLVAGQQCSLTGCSCGSCRSFSALMVCQRRFFQPACWLADLFYCLFTVVQQPMTSWLTRNNQAVYKKPDTETRTAEIKDYVNLLLSFNN